MAWEFSLKKENAYFRPMIYVMVYDMPKHNFKLNLLIMQPIALIEAQSCVTNDKRHFEVFTKLKLWKLAIKIWFILTHSSLRYSHVSGA